MVKGVHLTFQASPLKRINRKPVTNSVAGGVADVSVMNISCKKEFEGIFDICRDFYMPSEVIVPYAKSPTIARKLFAEKFTCQYGFQKPRYSPAEIEAIIDYTFDEGKDFGDKLKEALDISWSGRYLCERSQIDFVAQKLKEEPETVEKFKFGAPRETYTYLRAHEWEPEFVEQVAKLKLANGDLKYFDTQINELVELRKKYPDVVDTLVFDTRACYLPKAIKHIAPTYEDNKEIFEKFDIEKMKEIYNLSTHENLDDKETINIYSNF